MSNLENIKLKPSQIDARGPKIDLGALQDTILGNHGVSNTSKRLASSLFGARRVILAPFLDPKASSNGDQNVKNAM